MGTLTIGSRLVRTFGQGKSLRRIVTEVVDGKTYTRVLNAEGEILKERVKMIERMKVGNKKVSTITKVTEGADGQLRKYVYNRVYNQEGKFLGSRLRYIPDLGNPNLFRVSKQAAHENNNLSKLFANDRALQKELRYTFPGASELHEPSAIIHYNNKGLPRPYTLLGGDDMTLREMRNWHFQNAPEIPYSLPGFKLGFLDNRGLDTALSKMNNLDQFI